jgi:hypothetical protein
MTTATTSVLAKVALAPLVLLLIIQKEKNKKVTPSLSPGKYRLARIAFGGNLKAWELQGPDIRDV